MSIGAFGENFPYSNFHDLNMDWIIKIAKDFLDQYTHIQQIITDGETSLQNTITEGETSLQNIITDGETSLQNSITEGLQQLQEKANNLESLLQEWYNTHSQDIANELTQALAEFASESARIYAETSQQLSTRANELIESMPSDVSQIVATLDGLSDGFKNFCNNATMTHIDDYYFRKNQTFVGLSTWQVAICPAKPGQTFLIKSCYQFEAAYFGWQFTDASFNIISSSEGILPNQAMSTDVFATAPTGAVYLIVNNITVEDGYYGSEPIFLFDPIMKNELTGYLYDTGVKRDGMYFNTRNNAYATLDDSYHCITAPCKEGDIFYINGCGYGSTTANPTYMSYVIRNSEGNIIKRAEYFVALNLQADKTFVTIPANGAEIIVSWTVPTVGFLKKLGNPQDNDFWVGKKIVWFGTSIPAGELNGLSYPEIVASNLKATVYNESVGSSPMSDIVPINESRMRNLSMTYAEKQVQSWWNSLTDAEKLIARDTSYDYKVTKYLTGGSVGPVDVYVFDHGYNDYYYPNPENYDVLPDNPYDKHYPRGAAHFLIQSILNDNPNAVILWISHYEGGLYDPTNKQSWGKPVVPLQKHIAEDHQIPLCPLYEYTGWGNPTKVTTTGYWSNGYWVNSGGTSREDYVKNCAIADGIHPSTDKSGKALNKIADFIVKWMRSIR